MASHESQWERGHVHFADIDQVSKNEWHGSDMNFGQDSWDDSIILDIFDEAIKSHKTKNDKKNTVKLKNPKDTADSADFSMPGSWISATNTARTTDKEKTEKIENMERNEKKKSRGTVESAALFDRVGSAMDRKGSLRETVQPGHVTFAADGVYNEGERKGGDFQKYLSSNRGEKGLTQSGYREAERPPYRSGAMQDNTRAPSSSYSTSQPSVPGRGEHEGSDAFYEPHNHPQNHPQNHPYNAQNQSNQSNQSNQYNQCPQEHNPHNPHSPSSELEESFNAMLMAWYQSGYATGRYQTLLELNKKNNNNNSNNNSNNMPFSLSCPPYPPPPGPPLHPLHPLHPYTYGEDREDEGKTWAPK